MTLPMWDRSDVPIATTSPVETLRGRRPAEVDRVPAHQLHGAVGRGEPVGHGEPVPHDAGDGLHDADRQHHAGPDQQLLAVLGRDAAVDRQTDDGGHHGLAAHPGDPEGHPAEEGPPLSLGHPPQVPTRGPVIGRSGVVEGELAHSPHGTDRHARDTNRYLREMAHNGGVMIRPVELSAIRAGEIDLAFRRWDRPRVVVGTKMRTAVGLLEVTSVDEVDVDAITDEDAHRAGATSREALLEGPRGTRGPPGVPRRAEVRRRGPARSPCAPPHPRPPSWPRSRPGWTASTGPRRSARGPAPPSTWSTGSPRCARRTWPRGSAGRRPTSSGTSASSRSSG